MLLDFGPSLVGILRTVGPSACDPSEKQKTKLNFMKCFITPVHFSYPGPSLLPHDPSLQRDAGPVGEGQQLPLVLLVRLPGAQGLPLMRHTTQRTNCSGDNDHHKHGLGNNHNENREGTESYLGRTWHPTELSRPQKRATKDSKAASTMRSWC